MFCLRWFRRRSPEPPVTLSPIPSSVTLPTPSISSSLSSIPVPSFNRTDSFTIEEGWLHIPAYFHDKRENTPSLPRVFQVEPLCELIPQLYLGRLVCLCLPERNIFPSFVIGVYRADYFRAILVLVSHIYEQWELVHLISLRPRLTIRSSSDLLQDGKRWAFLSNKEIAEGIFRIGKREGMYGSISQTTALLFPAIDELRARMVSSEERKALDDPALDHSEVSNLLLFPSVPCDSTFN